MQDRLSEVQNPGSKDSKGGYRIRYVQTDHKGEGEGVEGALAGVVEPKGFGPQLDDAHEVRETAVHQRKMIQDRRLESGTSTGYCHVAGNA